MATLLASQAASQAAPVVLEVGSAAATKGLEIGSKVAKEHPKAVAAGIAGYLFGSTIIPIVAVAMIIIFIIAFIGVVIYGFTGFTTYEQSFKKRIMQNKVRLLDTAPKRYDSVFR